MSETESGVLVYEPLGEDRARGRGIAAFQVVAIAAIAGAALSVLVAPWAGLVGLIGMGGVAGYFVFGRRRGARVTLRVEAGVLRVERGGEGVGAFKLEELENVTLDVREIQRVEEGGSAIPAMRVIDARVAAPVDKARIVLVARGREPITLSDDHLAHMDATEWMGKIRVFLRRQGWVPLDEREAPASAAPDGEAPDSEAPDSGAPESGGNG